MRVFVCVLLQVNTGTDGGHLRSKYVIPVVDEDPSHPPARDQPAFSQATARQDGNVAAERRHGGRAAARENLQTRAANKINIKYLRIMLRTQRLK